MTDPGHTPLEALHLASGQRLEAVARDAGGGTYFLCGDGGGERPVLYTDSEGGAVLPGTSLAGALTTIVQLPYWPDCVTAGDLTEGRLSALEAEYLADIPDLAVRRARLVEALGLPAGDGLALLSAAAARTVPEYVPRAEDGRPYRCPASPVI